MLTPISLITLNHYLLLSGVLFILGLIGFMTRRNLIIMFLCTELMLLAAAVAMFAFGAYYTNPQGQVFLIFILTVAAAEAALALALVVMLYRKRNTLDVQRWSKLKG